MEDIHVFQIDTLFVDAVCKNLILPHRAAGQDPFCRKALGIVFSHLVGHHVPATTGTSFLSLKTLTATFESGWFSSCSAGMTHHLHSSFVSMLEDIQNSFVSFRI
jgi:hypothetical protein